MTIYDIAKEAGVSASTVSRVITGNVKVKKETQDKVNELLSKYDFVPDPNAQGLVSGSSKLVGIVLEDIRNEHHTSIAYVIENKLREKGYCGIILSSGAKFVEIEDCISTLVQRKVDGIILVGSLFQDEKIIDCINTNFPSGPTILLNGEYSSENLWSIVINEFEGVYKCVDLLYNSGKRNIAYIQKPRTASGERKRDGYIKKMVELGYPKESLVIIDAEPSIESGYLCTMKAFYTDKTIDAIIYSEDLIAIGGIKALHALNKSIPGDVAVIGIDNSIYCDIITPRLTSLNTALEELGRVSINLLLDILDGENPPKTKYLDIDIVIRETT